MQHMYDTRCCHCSLALFEKGPTGKLVGEDQFGNKYYEDDDCGYGTGGVTSSDFEILLWSTLCHLPDALKLTPAAAAPLSE